jgi:hypothetical protein
MTRQIAPRSLDYSDAAEKRADNAREEARASADKLIKALQDREADRSLLGQIVNLVRR